MKQVNIYLLTLTVAAYGYVSDHLRMPRKENYEYETAKLQRQYGKPEEMSIYPEQAYRKLNYPYQKREIRADFNVPKYEKSAEYPVKRRAVEVEEYVPIYEQKFELKIPKFKHNFEFFTPKFRHKMKNVIPDYKLNHEYSYPMNKQGYKSGFSLPLYNQKIENSTKRMGTKKDQQAVEYKKTDFPILKQDINENYFLPNFQKKKKYSIHKQKTKKEYHLPRYGDKANYQSSNLEKKAKYNLPKFEDISGHQEHGQSKLGKAMKGDKSIIQFSGRVDFHHCSSRYCVSGGFKGFNCDGSKCDYICKGGECFREKEYIYGY